MADSILRLRVQSDEYDNKLKRAAEGIQRYAEQCRAAGGTLEHLDDGVEQFVRELGKMDTTAKGAKGSLSEMTKAFTEMSVQYNKLTDAEKKWIEALCDERLEKYYQRISKSIVRTEGIQTIL